MNKRILLPLIYFLFLLPLFFSAGSKTALACPAGDVACGKPAYGGSGWVYWPQKAVDGIYYQNDPPNYIPTIYFGNSEAAVYQIDLGANYQISKLRILPNMNTYGARGSGGTRMTMMFCLSPTSAYWSGNYCVMYDVNGTPISQSDYTYGQVKAQPNPLAGYMQNNVWYPISFPNVTDRWVTIFIERSGGFFGMNCSTMIEGFNNGGCRPSFWEVEVYPPQPTCTLTYSTPGESFPVVGTTTYFQAQGYGSNVNKTEIYWAPRGTQSWSRFAQCYSSYCQGASYNGSTTAYDYVCNAYNADGTWCSANPSCSGEGCMPSLGAADCGGSGRVLNLSAYSCYYNGCNTSCGYGTNTRVCSNAYGTTYQYPSCYVTPPPAGTCPTYCGYGGGSVPNGSCGYTSCPARPPCNRAPATPYRWGTDNGYNTWTSASSLQMGMIGTDPDSNMSNLYYQINYYNPNNGAWAGYVYNYASNLGYFTNYGSSIYAYTTFGFPDGVYQYGAYGIDSAGLWSGWSGYYGNTYLDGTGPGSWINLTNGGTYSGTVNITVSGLDRWNPYGWGENWNGSWPYHSGSGLNCLYLAIDGAQWSGSWCGVGDNGSRTFSWNTTGVSNGSHHIQTYGVDNAGNGRWWEDKYVTINNPGTLTVNTTPISGPVYVNGSLWGNGPQSRSLTPGTYTVSFGAVTNYNTPSSRSVTINANQTTTTTGTYTVQPGTLIVNTVGTNGSIMVDGTYWGMGPTQSYNGMTVGQHTVVCGSVTNYNGPVYSPGSTINISSNVTTTVTCTYTAQPGTLRVNTTPISLSPTITIKDGSGASVGSGTGPGPRTFNLNPGTYNVNYGVVTNYDLPIPNPKSVTITSNTTVTVTGAYTPQPGTITVNVTTNGAPPAASFTPSITIKDSAGVTTITSGAIASGVASFANLPPATYLVVFGPVSGYNTPAALTKVVTSNTVAMALGNYTLQPGTLSGIVFSDTDGDGFMNGSETGTAQTASAQISALKLSDGSRTTVSVSPCPGATCGQYSIATLVPGEQYRLEIIPNYSWNITLWNTSVLGTPTTFNYAPTGSGYYTKQLGNDFPFTAAAGVTQTVNLGIKQLPTTGLTIQLYNDIDLNGMAGDAYLTGSSTSGITFDCSPTG